MDLFGVGYSLPTTTNLCYNLSKLYSNQEKRLFVMKIFLTILLLCTFAFALDSNVATKDDIRMLSKQIEQMQYNIDKRFEMMNESFNKRFEQIDKRFEMMQHSFDKRFEQVDKRFETLTDFLMALTAGIFGLIGFMMWDRRTVVEKAKAECAKEVRESEDFNKKADKEYVDRLIKAMNELLLLKDETAKDVFKKYGLL